MPPPAHIRSASDLITDHNAVREGFLRQAFAKTQKATPYVQDAHRLWEALSKVEDVLELTRRQDLELDLLAASGFSDKARGHLKKPELDESLTQVLETIASGADGKWREEIMYRYLLTKGDSLGGSMRNYVGAAAGSVFASAILSALKERSVTPDLQQSTSGSEKVREMRWGDRMVLIDKQGGMINNNIDVILLDVSSVATTLDATTTKPKRAALIKPLLVNPNNYIACGELKGGIDPAGADEHWKTAVSALDRIRDSFTEHASKIFFIGSAIASAMAVEIYRRLENGRLAYAANLTKPEQVSALARWLVSL